MPHQCVRCGTLYPDGSAKVLEGCSCGSRFFFFVKQEHIDHAHEFIAKVAEPERRQIERDVMDMVGRDDVPVVFDLESIRSIGSGKFELDLVSMFSGKPLVYKLEEGKYIIDLPSSFQFAEHKPVVKK